MTTNAQTELVVATGLAALELARRATLKLVDDLSDEQLTHQPADDATHAAWILAHLAWTGQHEHGELTRQGPEIAGDCPWDPHIWKF